MASVYWLLWRLMVLCLDVPSLPQSPKRAFWHIFLGGRPVTFYMPCSKWTTPAKMDKYVQKCCTLALHTKQHTLIACGIITTCFVFILPPRNTSIGHSMHCILSDWSKQDYLLDLQNLTGKWCCCIDWLVCLVIAASTSMYASESQ